MSIPGRLGRVSVMLQVWHLAFMHFFLPVKVGVVKILVLTSICQRLGSCLYAYRVVRLSKCLATDMLLKRFHSFITALLVGTMVGWYVCTRDRQFFDVCCFCSKSSLRGISFTLFHCFVMTLIGQALWSRCVTNSLLCSMKSAFLVHILLYQRN